MLSEDTPVTLNEVAPATMEETVKWLVAELEKTKAKLEKTNGRIARIENFVHGIRGGFQPAVRYSLLETAVYNSMSRPSEMNDKQYDYLKFASANAANGVLLSFLDTDSSEMFDSFRHNKSLDHLAKVKPALELLAGLILFIENVGKDVLDTWPPERSAVAHNGSFLQAMYPPEPVSGANAEERDAIIPESEVKAMVATFQSNETQTASSIRAGVTGVHAVLADKGLTPTDCIDAMCVQLVGS